MTTSPSKEVYEHFRSLFRLETGYLYPPVWGRDMKIIKSLLNEYTKLQLVQFLELYFEGKEKIYSIPFFKVRLPDLMQLKVQSTKFVPKPMEDHESWRFNTESID